MSQQSYIPRVSRDLIRCASTARHFTSPIWHINYLSYWVQPGTAKHWWGTEDLQRPASVYSEAVKLDWFMGTWRIHQCSETIRQLFVETNQCLSKQTNQSYWCDEWGGICNYIIMTCLHCLIIYLYSGRSRRISKDRK